MQHRQEVANFWPTKRQGLLLRACLLHGAEALEAWRECEKLFDENKIGAAERRLLPLLYRNLRDQGIHGPLIGRLKEEYNRTWSQNQFSFHRAAALISAFNHAGIQTIVLKGMALATLFYEDAALRPMVDVDLLVRRRDALSSIRFLNNLGWKSKYASAEALVPFEHAVEFNGAACLNLDLHWRALWEGWHESGDDDFWDASIPFEIGGVPTRTLNPADHLLYVCVHGAKWNDTAPVRWVADAMMILRSDKYKVDWSRLIRLARQRHVTLPVADALSYLHQSLGASVPTEILSGLQSTRTSMIERRFYKIRLGPNDALRTFPILWHWLGSLRSECKGNLFQRLTQFLRYLQCLWAIDRMRKVPAYFTSRVFRRAGQLLKLRLRGKLAATRPAE